MRSLLRGARPACNAARAAAVLLAFAIFPSSARQLPAIDRLAEAPVRADAVASSVATKALPASASPASPPQVDARLGVPAFLWGKGGPAVGVQAKSASDAGLRGMGPEQAARAHLRRLAATYALPSERIDPLPALFTQNLAAGASLVKFRNRIGGIEVFREEAAVLMGADRDLVAIGGFLTGGDADGPFAAGAAEAIAVALRDWSFDAGIASRLVAADTRDDYAYFDLPAGTASADGSKLKSAVRAKKVLFRLPGKLRPAYYIEVEIADGAEPREIDRYAYVVDAGDLSVLFRHDQTADAAFAYRVFAETSGINLPLPSPSGRNGYPHPAAVPNGYQGPFVSPNLITLQNLPFSRNDPWLANGAMQTSGNNVDAFADLVSPDGFSAGDLRATRTSPGVFDRTFNPAQTPGSSTTQVMAAVTNLFYMNNWLHDWYYDAGFDEASGNAQNDNYGRGGVAGDSIFAEAQDYAGRNNANMSTPADGARPRMRMYVFDGQIFVQNTIDSPATIAGQKDSTGAQFGPTAYNASGNVIYSIPANGCASVSPAVSGQIALIDRGTCTFKTKVRNAQNAGAIGVIIANNVAGLVTMGDDTSITTTITIPAVMFTQDDGTAIKAQLPAPGVNATLTAASGIDRDGTMDNTIIAHEWGHYISNRLIANSSGLTSNQSQGMGEGWADFHSLLLLVKGSDAALPNNANFSGTYAEGAYALGGSPDPNSSAFYYGFRRYPYSRDMTRNPLTFRHIANGVALPATPAPNFGATGSNNAEVHNTGEVWASMLWECYSNLLNDTGRLTFDQAQDRMKRYLVAGYKLTPSTPTFLEARDALLAAIAAQDSADYALCFQGFAKRGAGAGAVAPDRFDSVNAGVVESFVGGGVLAFVSAAIADTPAFCDADGILDNSETGALSITVQNTGSLPLVATTGSVSSGNPHVSFPGGVALTIPPTNPGQSVTVTIPIHLAGASGVEAAAFTITLDDPGLSIARPVVANASVWVNADLKVAQSATDSVEAPNTAWTTGNTFDDPGVSGNPTQGLSWRRIAISGTDHRWLGPDPGIPLLSWLQSPPLHVAASGNFSFTFRHRFSFESSNFDGGQIQISANNGTTWTSIGASASPGYNGTIVSGGSNPLGGQQGYVTTNAAWPALQTVTVNLGPAYQGQTVLIRFAIGTDTAAPAPGWEIDDIAFANITNTPFDALAAHAGACWTVTAQAGTPQSALLNTAFGTALKALVKNGSGTPQPGQAVTFAAPVSGPSGTFAASTTVLTDGAGIATAPALTANGLAGQYAVTATIGAQAASYTLRNVIVPPNGGLDVDANLGYDPLFDGLLIMRYLFGFTGPELTANATGIGAIRMMPDDIVQYLDGIRALLDVDANGSEDPLTDGVLIVRYLQGLRGSALVAGVLAPNATRTDPTDIEHYIQGLMP